MSVEQSMLVVARRPLHWAPMSVANACFIGTLLTDVTYWRSAEMMWADPPGCCLQVSCLARLQCSPRLSTY